MELVKQLERALTATEIEKSREQLKIDYIQFTEFVKSEKLQEYKRLEDYLLSPEFEKNKKKIESLSYKNSVLFQKEKAYKKIKKNKYLKSYLKLRETNQLSKYLDFKNSDLFKEYKEVEGRINSPSFSKKENKDEVFLFRELSKRADIKEFCKFKRSKLYKHYKIVKDSPILEEYNNLLKYLNSSDYKTEKEFLLNKNRFQATEEYKKLQSYSDLNKTEEIRNYNKYKNSNVFDSLREWELTFEDDFSNGKLDEHKWASRYHHGAEVIGENYSLVGDKHLFTDGNNLELKNGILNIITRREKIVGKRWSNLLGFTEKEFDYTSGMINTSKSFRQKYGRFEAKIKISQASLNHCFWLMSDFALPHIDIFKTVSNKELISAVFTDKEHVVVNKLNGFDFSKDFMIYTLIWEKDSIGWYVNDVKVYEQTKNIPNKPMYISLGTCVYNDIEDLDVQRMEIDWVKCYKKLE